MPQVEFEKVGKSFGALAVMRELSFRIEDGEFAVLVGPSGCGKSTLLRMLAGLEEITAGEIRIAGRAVNDLPAKDRDIAMVFQSYALYPHMRVVENMGFSLRLRRAPKAAIAERVGAAARTLGLDRLLERYPRELSGGQRQRVAMGRALVRSPSVFLFDEPLSNLDAKLRVQMRTELRHLHQKLGATTIYVTHDQVEAMTMADRIVMMRDGAIEQVGRPLEIYDRPANHFVAGFIGSPAMNVLPGRIRAGADPAVALDGGGVLPLGHVPSLAPGRAVAVGIRPEHLRPDPDGPLLAEVEVIEPTGAETDLSCRCGGQPLMVALRDRGSYRPGQTLRLAPHAGPVHLFDAETSARLTHPESMIQEYDDDRHETRNG